MVDDRKYRVSFLVLSYNEEPNVENAVGELLSACETMKDRLAEVEIILVDDGSTDRTGEIVDRLAARDPRMRVARHPKNRGIGAAYKLGVHEATKEYVMWVPGENTVPAEGLVSILSELGNADLVIPYPSNPKVRTGVRQVISTAFHLLLTGISKHDIKYYNGLGLFRRELVVDALPRTESHAFQVELLVKLLQRGATYVQTGMTIRDRPAGHSKALRLRNLVGVGSTLVRLKLGIH